MNQRGFSALVVILVMMVVGLLGVVGWLVYDRQNDNTNNKEAVVTQPTSKDADTASDSGQKTVDGITYTVPTGWKAAKDPFQNPEETGSEPYLRSPDYKEAGDGQLGVMSGAFINFRKLEWVGIDATTTPEQAANVVKNGEGGYLDPASVKLTAAGGKQVVMFNSGHNTDGVTVFYKTSGGQWLDATFGTAAGGDADYDAQKSPHYKTYLGWLDEFVALNP